MIERSSEPRVWNTERCDDNIREKHRRWSYTSRESLRNEISKSVYYESSVLISFRTVGKLSSLGTSLSRLFPYSLSVLRCYRGSGFWRMQVRANAEFRCALDLRVTSDARRILTKT